MRIFEVFPEYQCDPIWEKHPDDVSVCIHPQTLPISKELARDLELWGDEYNDFFIDNDTTFEERAALKEKECEYLARGRELAERLQVELGNDAKVIFKGWL